MHHPTSNPANRALLHSNLMILAMSHNVLIVLLKRAFLTATITAFGLFKIPRGLHYLQNNWCAAPIPCFPMMIA